MGQPIRWDNVNGGGLSEASRPLDSAANLFQNAFSGLQGALKEREAIDAANQQNTVKNNTTAYLDAVANLSNPDAVRAAQGQGGALAELRQKFGFQIDADKVRGAADQRVAALQDMAQKDILYRHSQLDEATSKDVQAFQMARMKGDKAGMDAAMSSYMGKGGRDPTALLKFADERDWLMNERGMKLKNHQASMDQIADNIRHNKASEAIQQQQASTQAQQVRQQGEFQTWQMNSADADRAAAKRAGMAAALKNSLGEEGNLFADGIYTGNQSDVLRKFMKDNNVGDGNTNKQANIISALEEVRKSGVEVKGPNGRRLLDGNGKPIVIRDLPMSAVKAAIAGAKDDLFHLKGWNGAPAENMKEALTAALSASVVDSKGNLDSRVLADLQKFNDTLQNARDNAPGIRPMNQPRPKQK